MNELDEEIFDEENKNDYVVVQMFTPDECDAIIKHCNKHYNLRDAGVSSPEGKPRGNMRPNVRNNQIAWLDNNDESTTWFRDKIKELILSVNNQKYNYDISWAQKPQFTKYSCEEFYSWHIDMGIKHPANKRKLSTTVQLSDPKNHLGGELMLLISGSQYHTVKLEKGQGVIFPSHVPHQVTPVESPPGSK